MLLKLYVLFEVYRLPSQAHCAIDINYALDHTLVLYVDALGLLSLEGQVKRLNLPRRRDN